MKGIFRVSTFCFVSLFFSADVFAKSAIKKVDTRKTITQVEGVSKSSVISKRERDKVFFIDKAIAMAYKNNPQLKAAIAAKYAADEQLAQAFSEFYPTIIANFKTGINAGKEQHSDTNTKSYNHSLGVDMVLNLYGDNTMSKLDKVNLLLISERFNYKKTEQDILLRTVSAFMDVWAAAEQVKIYTKMRDNFKECMEFSTEQFKAGFSKIQDLESFKASYADAEYKLTSAKANLKIAKAALAQYTGKKPKGVVSIPEVAPLLPNNIKDLIARSEKENAGFLAEKYKAESYLHEIDVQKGALPPYINFEGGINRDIIGKNRTTTPNGVSFGDHQRTDTYKAGISLSLPIWKNATASGTNPYSSIRKAKMDAESARFGVMAVKSNLIAEVSKAWYSMVSSKAQIDESIAAVKSAEVSVKGYKAQEKLGASSATDVVYNENKLLEARLQYVEARKKYIVSAYQIKSILGEISPDFKKYSIAAHDVTSNEKFVKYAPVSTKAAQIK